MKKKQEKMSSSLREFNEVAGQIDGLYHEIAAGMNLSDSAFDILYILNDNDGCNQSLFSKCTGHGKTTVNSSLHKLEREGILRLTEGTGRNTRVFITEKGKEVLRETIQRVIQIENDIFLEWSEQDRQQFLSLNRRYQESLKQKIEELFKEK